MDRYYGTYQRFETLSKKDATPLLGADTLVGDVCEVVFAPTQDQHRAWLENRFGARVGFFASDFSRELSIASARGWTIRAILSFVAYTDHPNPGHYWGEVAVICYDPSLSDSFDPYVESLSRRMADGVRPEISLGEQGIAHVIESKGSWAPSKRVPFPEKEGGTAIIKSHREITERIIEKGRQGNKGCYLAAWAFLILVVAAIVFALKSCGVF